MDRNSDVAVVRFQHLDYGRASLELIEQWKGVLTRVGREVTA